MLRKGLGYCWSVAVAAAPEVGRPAFEELVSWAGASDDPDLAWVALGRTCASGGFERLDLGWVTRLLERL